MGLKCAEKILSSLEGVKVESDVSGEFSATVSVSSYVNICRALRDRCGFDLFVDLAGVDNLPNSPRFEVVVHLFSTKTSERIRIRVFAPDDSAPEVPSISDVYKGASWAEREAWDQYGIRFSGHPDLRRILNAYDIDFHPQRKDFPLRHHRD